MATTIAACVGSDPQQLDQARVWLRECGLKLENLGRLLQQNPGDAVPDVAEARLLLPLLAVAVDTLSDAAIPPDDDGSRLMAVDD